MPKYDRDHPSVDWVVARLGQLEIDIPSTALGELNRILRLQLEPTRNMLYETYGKAQGARILLLELEMLARVLQDNINEKEI